MPSSIPFVGFAGSRSLDPAWLPVVGEVVDDVLYSGRGVAVGCAAGADAIVRDRASLWMHGWGGGYVTVFPRRLYPDSTFAGSLARRSIALVHFVAASGPGAEFVGFPSSPCPAELVPSRSASACFCGTGAGTWATLALAAGLGLPICVRRAGDFQLPAWQGGQWESSVYGNLWVPAALATQGTFWD